MIKSLKKMFKCKVGYSGHESTVSPSILAWYLGATVIERHITLDQSMWGSDQKSSIEPSGLMKLVKGIRGIEEATNDNIVKKVVDFYSNPKINSETL